MVEVIRCACGALWRVWRVQVPWRSKEGIPCPECDREVTRERGSDVVRLERIVAGRERPS